MGDPEQSREDPQIARTHLANERTYLAWIRTSLALIAAGFAVARFLPVAEPDRAHQVAGGALIAFGAVVAGSGYLRWRSNVKRIARGDGMVGGRGPHLLAGGIAAISVVALTIVLFSGP